MKSGRSAWLQASRKRIVEVGAVLGVYILFLIIAVYSGQTTMNIDIISPLEGTRFHSSPVELAARVTIKGVPAADVEMTFTIHFDEKGEASIKTYSDGRGIARLVLPLQSGNCTWHVTAMKEGYPTIVSRSGSFSINLAFIVYGLLPSTSTLAVPPVTFVTRVVDMKDRLVTSANVTFYVDSTAIGSSLTATNGIAKLSSTVDPGQHTWFASANMGGEGGVSDPTSFIVGQASSLATSDSGFFRSNLYQPGSNNFRVMSAQLIADIVRVVADMNSSSQASHRRHLALFRT